MSIEETKRRREERLRRQQQEQAHVTPAVVTPAVQQQQVAHPVQQVAQTQHTCQADQIDAHVQALDAKWDKGIRHVLGEMAEVHVDLDGVQAQLRAMQQAIVPQLEEILSLLKALPMVTAGPVPTGATATVKGIEAGSHTFTSADLEDLNEEDQDDLEDISYDEDDQEDHEFAEDEEVVAAVPSSPPQKRVSSTLQQLPDGEPRALMLPVPARTLQTRKVRRLKDVR
jgi:hypothetical protein